MSSSYSIAPRAYTSTATVRSEWPANCSGAMYRTVPTGTPAVMSSSGAIRSADRLTRDDPPAAAANASARRQTRD